MEFGVAASVPAVLLLIAIPEPTREQDVVAVRHYVVPRRALAVGEVPAPNHLRSAEVVALPGVRDAHEMILPGLADAYSIWASEAHAISLETTTPVRRDLVLRMEPALAVQVVERAMRRKDIDENRLWVVALLQQPGVPKAPWKERVRRKSVGARVAAGIEPSLLRGAIELERHEVIGKSITVWIDVCVVVMRAEENSGIAASFAHRAKRRGVSTWRIDVWETVVVSPALPVVLYENRVVEAVLRRKRNVRRRFFVVTTPLVEAHPRTERGMTRACLVS